MNVDGGASLTVDGLLVADCVRLLRRRRVRARRCAPARQRHRRRRGAAAARLRAPHAARRESSVFGNVAARRGRRPLRVHAVHADTDGRYRFVRKRGAARRRRARLRRLDARARRLPGHLARPPGPPPARGRACPTWCSRAVGGRKGARRGNAVARDIDGAWIAVLVGASAVFQNGAALPRLDLAERRRGRRAARRPVALPRRAHGRRRRRDARRRRSLPRLRGRDRARSPSRARRCASRFSRSVVCGGNAVQVDEAVGPPPPVVPVSLGALRIDRCRSRALRGARARGATGSPSPRGAHVDCGALDAARGKRSAPDGGAVFVAPSDEMNGARPAPDVRQPAAGRVRRFAALERNNAEAQDARGAAGALMRRRGRRAGHRRFVRGAVRQRHVADASVAGGEGGGVNYRAPHRRCARAGLPVRGERSARKRGGGARGVAASPPRRRRLERATSRARGRRRAATRRRRRPPRRRRSGEPSGAPRRRRPPPRARPRRRAPRRRAPSFGARSTPGAMSRARAQSARRRLRASPAPHARAPPGAARAVGGGRRARRARAAHRARRAGGRRRGRLLDEGRVPRCRACVRGVRPGRRVRGRRARRRRRRRRRRPGEPLRRDDRRRHGGAGGELRGRGRAPR